MLNRTKPFHIYFFACGRSFLRYYYYYISFLQDMQKTNITGNLVFGIGIVPYVKAIAENNNCVRELEYSVRVVQKIKNSNDCNAWENSFVICVAQN